jgi:hypothetical protein
MPLTTMMHLNALAVAAAATLVLGCATPASPSIDSTRVQPEQMFRSLSSRKLSVRGDPDPVYGLAQIKEYLRPVLDRCRVDGGEITILGRAQIQFAPRVEGNGGRGQAQLLLPVRFACRTPAALLWGAESKYLEPTFFASQWAGEVFYSVVMQFGFLPGSQLELTEASSASRREAASNMSKECSALRLAYNEKVRSSPTVGMPVAFGTIIDLRPPLALIQYDSFGRQLKGREQEWVQISSLSAGTDCPR